MLKQDTMVKRAVLFSVGCVAVSQAFVAGKNGPGSFLVQRHIDPTSIGRIQSATASEATPKATTDEIILSTTRGGGNSVAASTTTPIPDLKSPVAIYEGAVVAGTNKAQAPIGKIFKLGIMGGIHIAFGAYLAISVGGNLPGIAASNPGLQKLIMGGMGLPTGLIMTLITGAELFTGNTALVTAAYMEKKVTSKQLLKNWFWSYLGNFVGSLYIAYLAFHSGTLGTAPGAVNIALAKCSVPFMTNVYRGILCNFLVCMAVYMASGCSTMIGKMTAVWFPISAFVALGLDHSIANMFLIPLAILRGADITIVQMFTKNLIPVTLGNIIGGAFMVMFPIGTTYGSWFQKDKK